VVIRVWLALIVFGGCVRDDEYRCTSDEQCDLGEAGRCELDGRCTAHDLDCPSTRRYTEHSGAVTGTCFDDAVVPLNACADGQPPARPEECFADVCAALPACCETGWSSACVQQAQLACPELRCDTRIAITATVVEAGVTRTEVWDLRSPDGVTWTPTQLSGSAIVWLAPARDSSEPRLARLEPSQLVVEDVAHPLTERSYTDVASVDFDRTGRDTVVLGSTDPAIVGSAFIDVLDLSRETRREIPFEQSTRVEWGDLDHDAFPDAVIANSQTRYVLATNELDVARQRVFTPSGAAAVSNPETPGQTPEIRGLAWADLDGNGALDLIVGGNSIRVHLAGGTLATVDDQPAISADCHPLATAGLANCAAGNPVGANASSFTVVAIPRAGGGAEIVAAAFPQLEATSIEIVNGVPVTATLTPISIPDTGPPLVALAARDLDHDGVLDLIAIDQTLGVWTRIAPATALTRAVVGSMTAFTAVRLSVSGAPLP
jgi:hypothetical protein